MNSKVRKRAFACRPDRSDVDVVGPKIGFPSDWSAPACPSFRSLRCKSRRGR